MSVLSAIVDLMKPRFSFSFISLLVVLCSIINHRAVSAQEVAPNSVVAQINREELGRLVPALGAPKADERGLHWRLALADGLTDDFSLGVFETSDQASQFWQAVAAPEGATPAALTGVGEQVKAWRLGATDPYRLVFRRLNVVVQFDWNGDLPQSQAFARQIDEALQNDQKLAPRAPQVVMPTVQVLAPAVVPDNELLSVLVTTRGSKIMSLSGPLIISLVQRADDEVAGRAAEIVNIIDNFAMDSQGNPKMVLLSPGLHTLTFHFVTYSAVIFDQKFTTRVLTPEETLAFNTMPAQAWQLPPQGIELFPALADGNETAATTGETISLQPKSLRPFDSSGEAAFWRLRAWNELARVLSLRWLPPLEMLQVAVNGNRLPYREVAYASYTRNGSQIIVMSEIGRQTWIYVEQPDPVPATAKTITSTELLQPELTRMPTLENQSALSANEVSFPLSTLTRTLSMRRKNAADANAPQESVRVTLIHATSSSLLNLNSPGY